MKLKSSSPVLGNPQPSRLLSYAREPRTRTLTLLIFTNYEESIYIHKLKLLKPSVQNLALMSCNDYWGSDSCIVNPQASAWFQMDCCEQTTRHRIHKKPTAPDWNKKELRCQWKESVTVPIYIQWGTNLTAKTFKETLYCQLQANWKVKVK
jgi:hypothetical protein